VRCGNSGRLTIACYMMEQKYTPTPAGAYPFNVEVTIATLGPPSGNSLLWLLVCVCPSDTNGFANLATRPCFGTSLSFGGG
ncbi:MAG: hypothetical protein ACM3VS_12320, partial [Candidatus Dadabacteria bacterium]